MDQLFPLGHVSTGAKILELAPRPRHQIKFNLMVSADCEPTSASGASASNRQVDRVFDLAQRLELTRGD
jgi:hypothetical protein